MRKSIYTMQQWEKDGTLKVQAGQRIDEEVYLQLLNSMPPMAYRCGVFQPGEAYAHDMTTGKALYQTFEKQADGSWMYVGLKPVHHDFETKLDTLPDGWVWLKGATTAPCGYRWGWNKQNPFGPFSAIALFRI